MQGMEITDVELQNYINTWGSASLKVVRFQENDQILCQQEVARD